jgi:hypothetical protein
MDVGRKPHRHRKMPRCLELEADMKASSAAVLKTVIDEARCSATIVYLSPFAYIRGQYGFVLPIVCSILLLWLYLL